jgi:hypothetical protein
LQENRSVATQFRQKPLLGKAQSPISFNALEILHGRLPIEGKADDMLTSSEDRV